MKMGKIILTIGEKDKFCRHKSPIFFKDIDTEKVLLSNKISSSE